MAAAAKPAKPAYELSGWERFKKDVVRDKWLYLLILPGMLFMLIFRYIPIFGNVIAFMDFNPYNMWNSTWVGFDQFIKLFNKPAFMQTFYNTLYISILKMVCGFPIPIILALMMNEMRNMQFKKVAQTLLYLPHFISWVVMAGLIMNFLDPSTGLVTALLKSITGKDLQVLTDKALFVPMLIITDIYKTMGWGTIIYFAALSGVDPQLYEAAEIDGARKWKQMINITLPAIPPTIVIMLILNCNNIVNAGFDQISVEPVIADAEEPYAITEADLPRIFEEYERLMQKILDYEATGKKFNFFHFMVDLEGGPCLRKRLTGCGAGNEYVAVTPDGDIYPCHQFVGRDGYRMGSVLDGTFDRDIQAKFAHNTVLNKEKCRDCWARFFCSGGCAANAEAFHGDISKPYDMECQMERKRLECAMAIYAKERAARMAKETKE